MSNRADFKEKLAARRQAVKEGRVMDAPETAQFVPEGQEWTLISIWGPHGPYAKSPENTVLVSGGFKTEDAALKHLKELLEKVPGLKAVQTVVFKTGYPIPIPLIPTHETVRHFDESAKEVSDQWMRFAETGRREVEAMRERQRIALARNPNLVIKKDEVDVTAQKEGN